MIYIIGVEVDGPGTGAEHITSVLWLQEHSGKSNMMDSVEMARFIERGNVVQVPGPDGPVRVQAVKHAGGLPFLRSQPDVDGSDRLLSLPRFETD